MLLNLAVVIVLQFLSSTQKKRFIFYNPTGTALKELHPSPAFVLQHIHGSRNSLKLKIKKQDVLN
jgi:hypothetical protein